MREERRKNMPNRGSNDDTIADLAHGYLRHVARIQGDDPMDSSAAHGCQNCGVTGGYIERIWTDEGTKLLCEDCAEEVRRLERLADELASAPCCEQRQQILDTAETTAELVNRLRGHDMAQCAACASARASAAASGEGKVA